MMPIAQCPAFARCPAIARVSPAVATEAGKSAFNSPLENCLPQGPSIPELSPLSTLSVRMGTRVSQSALCQLHLDRPYWGRAKDEAG